MERHLRAKCCLPRFVLRSLAIDVPKMTRADSRQPSGAPAPTHEGKPGHACRSNRASDCVKLVPVKVLAGCTHDLDEDLRFSHPAIAAGLRCGCQPATPVLNSTTRFNPNHVPRPCLKILEMPHAPRSLLSNRTFWFEQQSQNTCVIADIQFSKEGPAGYRHDAQAVGAKVFLPKPYRLADVGLRIRALLEGRQWVE